MQNQIDKYWILWPLWLLSGAFYFPIYGVLWLLGYRKDSYPYYPKWFKWWGNRIDNLTDWVMESLHCAHIPGTDSEFNLSRIMKNRTTEGKWIRPYRIVHYRNCYPK